ncbi:hypothetical protein H257_01918 [Aphanomyces astaci]|uniref:Uncharacterized protein n=1 Tax=Aphanomyces astaci TaxID=112090 RepID=W4H6E6_APHAT|nr:hypothetical protein H257_01918 [Aphanomyces astaci]ETV86874.1 hypothetical protein H257_01918 [Aphanomyces astaci]|eukprot:XP_009823673.1 hypothetical protein H257_01918 [Aphanomyces astaci]
MVSHVLVVLLCVVAWGHVEGATKVFRSGVPQSTAKEFVPMSGNVPVDSHTSYNYERGSQDTTSGQRSTGTASSPYENVLGGNNVGMLGGIGIGGEQAVLPSDNNFALQSSSPLGNVGGLGGGVLGHELGYGLMNTPPGGFHGI